MRRVRRGHLKVKGERREGRWGGRGVGRGNYRGMLKERARREE